MPPEGQDRREVAQRRIPAAAALFDRSTRGRLLTAAATVAVHGGYRDATVERVLENAGASWADFTGEFESLADCFLAAQSAALECAAIEAERAAREADAAKGPEAAFAAALNRLLETISTHTDLARLALVESASLGSEGIERKEIGLQRFVTLLQDIAGSSGAGVPPLAAEMVAGGIYEILQRKVAAGELDRPDDLAAELRRLWLPLIGAGDSTK